MCNSLLPFLRNPLVGIPLGTHVVDVVSSEQDLIILAFATTTEKATSAIDKVVQLKHNASDLSALWHHAVLEALRLETGKSEFPEFTTLAPQMPKTISLTAYGTPAAVRGLLVAPPTSNPPETAQGISLQNCADPPTTRERMPSIYVSEEGAQLFSAQFRTDSTERRPSLVVTEEGEKLLF
eukprot:gene6351-7611_t